MRFFHRHRWEIVGRHYRPPMADMEFSGRGAHAKELLEQAMHGVTTLSLRCSECGAVAAEQMLGKWQEDAHA